MRAPLPGTLTVTQLFGGNRLGEALTTLYNGAPLDVLGHTGIDFAAAVGTPVFAVWDGTVHYGVEATGFGTFAVLLDARGRRALYGHLSAYSVAEGTAVHAGDQIALSGNSGRTTGPHLHLEVADPNPDFFNGYRGCHDFINNFDHDVVGRLNVDGV